MSLLYETLNQIEDIDFVIQDQVTAQLQNLMSPPGAFGCLGSMVSQYAAILGEAVPEMPRCCMVVAVADHGVAKKLVSAYPIETTLHMTENYLVSKGASANAFANYSASHMVVVDAGAAGDLSHVPGLWQRKIAYGTNDFTQGPAMTREQAVQALETGIEIVQYGVKEGYNCFSLGEMGIGNTTCSAAIAAVVTGLTTEKATGRGTGISDDRLRVKIEAVRTAIAVNKPNPDDGLDLLTKIGGFEIGTLAGVILGAAASKRAVILDGLNTTAAALIANAIAPKIKQYLFSSHLSGEPAHIVALAKLGLEPCVNMGVRLGEAIGASVVVNMLRPVVKMLTALEQDEKSQIKCSSKMNQLSNSCLEEKAELQQVIAAIKEQIRPLDQEAQSLCRDRLDQLTKPLDSLGKFEELACQLAGITGQAQPNQLMKKVLLFGEPLTSQEEKVLQTFAEEVKATVRFISEFKGVEPSQAFRTGIKTAQSEGEQGVQVLALGSNDQENGQLLEISRLERLTLLQEVDCSELSGLVGVILGAVSNRIALIVEGALATAAVQLAIKIVPQVKDYVIDSTDYLNLKLETDKGLEATLILSLIDASLHVLNDMKTFAEASVAVAQDGPGALKQIDGRHSHSLSTH